MGTIRARPEDFWRLAEQAERHGIRILREPISGEHFATSATDPTILYRVTGFSCTCKGFFGWQRCQHHSLLLAELGWLPDVDPEPDPTPLTPAVQPRSPLGTEATGGMHSPVPRDAPAPRTGPVLDQEDPWAA